MGVEEFTAGPWNVPTARFSYTAVRTGTVSADGLTPDDRRKDMYMHVHTVMMNSRLTYSWVKRPKRHFFAAA